MFKKGWGDTWFVINDRGNLLSCSPNFYNKEQIDTKIDDLSLTNIEHILANDWEVVGEKKKWWKPEVNEEYYSFYADGMVCVLYNDGLDFDKRTLAFGNCFKTREEAEFMAEKLKVIHELEEFAYENNSEAIDWNNKCQNKYYLVVKYKKNRTRCIDVCYAISLNEIPFNVYFTREDFARKAIEIIGEERILKYYFGVEDE